MELFGTGYVIDHCIAFLTNKRKEDEYRYYIADAIHNMNSILANVYGGNYMSVRFSAMMDNKPQDTRSGEEIKNFMMDKINSYGKGAAQNGADNGFVRETDA